MAADVVKIFIVLRSASQMGTVPTLAMLKSRQVPSTGVSKDDEPLLALSFPASLVVQARLFRALAAWVGGPCWSAPVARWQTALGGFEGSCIRGPAF